MRILIIHNQLWAHYKSKLFSEIYRKLRQDHPDDALEVIHIALYESSRKGMQDNDGKTDYSYPFRVLFRKSLDETRLPEKLGALTEAFRSFAPDVINITGYFDPAQLYLMYYAKLRGIKVVISSESSVADHARSWWKEKIKSLIVRGADAVFCFGKTSADYLEKLGVPSQKICVRNAAVVDDLMITQTFRQAMVKRGNGKLRFIYVGRLATEKNLPVLIQAFAAVSAAAPDKDVELLLLGEGPERSSLEALVSRLDQRKYIHFAGGVAWYDVPDYLAKSDVLVLPSLSEPWGLVVNEAMICEMPVIVSAKCGCVPDLVKHGSNGFIFDPEDQNTLTGALKFFVMNPEKVTPMGQASAALVKRFSASEVASEMVTCYRDLHKARQNHANT